jgi:SAM-dependent methyltransferase
MESAVELLKTLEAGRVLDVATGNGNFIHFLIENLKSYDEITGIDTSEKSAAAFEKAFAGKAVRLIKMDAARMDFPDKSFDTVAISNSLHHMPDLEATLAEMRRVLRPGGYFIAAEMYRDNQTETQMTHVLMHHWWAAVDRANGICHQETYTRQTILDLLGGLGLTGWRVDDMKDLEQDPRDPETVKYLGEVIDQYLKRSEGLKDENDLRARGMELRQRVKETGFQGASSLLIVGRAMKGEQ